MTGQPDTTDQNDQQDTEVDNQHLDQQDTGDTGHEDQDKEQGNAEQRGLLRDLSKARDQRDTARAEADTLRQRVETLQGHIVSALITERGYKPAAVWATGVTPGDMFDDNGDLNHEQLDASLNHAIEQFGLAIPKDPARVPTGGRKPAPEPGTTWADVVSPKK